MRQINDARDATVHRLKRTDQEIVEGLQVGEPSAARALVEKHGRGINARVWRMLGADPDHEDVVQQVLIRILKTISKLKDPDALPDWIGTITVNVVRNELRSRRLRRIFWFTDTLPEVPSSKDDPETVMMARQGLAVLGRLKDEDRILFVMRYVEGAPLQEIAATCGYSLATVKRRLVKARDAFLKKADREIDLAAWCQEGLRR